MSRPTGPIPGAFHHLCSGLLDSVELITLRHHVSVFLLYKDYQKKYKKITMSVTNHSLSSHKVAAASHPHPPPPLRKSHHSARWAYACESTKPNEGGAADGGTGATQRCTGNRTTPKSSCTERFPLCRSLPDGAFQRRSVPLPGGGGLLSST